MGPVVPYSSHHHVANPHSNIAEGLQQWPENMSFRVQPTMQELISTIRSMANGKGVGPDGVSVERFEVALSGDPAPRQRMLDLVVCM